MNKKLFILLSLLSVIFTSAYSQQDGIVINLKEKTNQELNEEMRNLQTMEYKQYIKSFTLTGDDGTISELGALDALEEFIFLHTVTISLQNNNIWDIRSLQDSIGLLRNLESLNLNFKKNNILTYASLNQALNNLHKLKKVIVSFNEQNCNNVEANYLKSEFIYFTRNACTVEKCDPNCQKCDHFDTKICTQCEGNQLLLNEKAECISFQQCEKMEGYFPEEINNQCVKCAENCYKCKDFQTCGICKEGHFKNQNKKCDPCTVSNCNLCSFDKQCDVCEDKHYLEEAKLFEDENMIYGYNELNENQYTFQRFYNLKQKKPKYNKEFQKTDGEDRCLPCSDENCLSCSGKNKCSTCDTGFYLSKISTPDNKKCFPCGDKNCNLCIDNKSCQDCAESFYRLEKQTDKLQCGACGEGCRHCTDDKTCIECKNQGHYLHKGQCIETCNINDGQILEKDKVGNQYCIDCTRNCLECEKKDKEIICLRCNLQSYLHEEQCYEQCPVGYASVPHWFSQKCKPCSEKCQDCSDYTDHCTICNNEEKEYYLIEDQRSPASKNYATCELEVPQNYFISDLEQRICKPCESPCAQCENSSTNCTACSEKGYYLDQKNSTCEECVQLCDKCDKADECIQCQEYTYLEQGRCVRNCSSGYKFNEKKQECETYGDATWVWVTAVIFIAIGSAVGIFLYYRKKKREQLLEQDDMEEQLDVQSHQDD